MSWTEIEKQLSELPADAVIKLLKGLHGFSAQNKTWLRSKLLPAAQDLEYLETCRRKVFNYVYKGTKGIPPMPRFGEARKAIAVSGNFRLMILSTTGRSCPRWERRYGLWRRWMG